MKNTIFVLGVLTLLMQTVVSQSENCNYNGYERCWLATDGAGCDCSCLDGFTGPTCSIPVRGSSNKCFGTTQTKTCWKKDCYGVETETKYTIKKEENRNCYYVLTTQVTITRNGRQEGPYIKPALCELNYGCTMPDCPANDAVCYG